MVALDDIRVSWGRPLRLAATAFPTGMLRCIPRTAGALSALLRGILVCDTSLLARELPAIWLLLRHSAIVHTALLACRPCVRNYVVCGALAATLALGYLAIAIVGIGVLQDDVPGVE